ncbi:MAG TPA: biotin/lipoyl-binding protein, partial [Paraburkholderia sp.]|nr:biotin/lipoyl-binding protein [Paraburkholderia sp.]
MTIRKIIGFVATLAIFGVAIIIGRQLWVHYMDEPWTRDGRVRADVVNIAPDVSGAVVELPVHDNQLVKKGDLLMQIDPSHYQIAVEQAQAAVAARKAELQMRRDDAQRRADMDSLVVSKENRDNATHTATAAEAQYEQAVAALDAAKLNLERTRVVAPVD